MTHENLHWPYWSIDLPGLTETNAHRLLAWAESESASLGGIAVDPASTFTVHLDEVTAEALSRALDFSLRSENLHQDHREVMKFVSELISEWLAGRPSSSDPG